MTDLTDEKPEFVDPPTSSRTRRGGKWVERLALLRERPGEWARWKELGATQSAGGLKRTARDGVFGPGVWEFTNRTVDGDRYIYARYLPEDGQ